MINPRQNVNTIRGGLLRLLHSISINIDLTLPTTQFIGPYTPLDARRLVGAVPANEGDLIALIHDLCYNACRDISDADKKCEMKSFLDDIFLEHLSHTEFSIVTILCRALYARKLLNIKNDTLRQMSILFVIILGVFSCPVTLPILWVCLLIFSYNLCPGIPHYGVRDFHPHPKKDGPVMV
jgi:hypothetical protein